MKNTANLSTIEKQMLEKLFQMQTGYVLNFSDKTMKEFFRDDVSIDIYNKKYDVRGYTKSKANRIRGLWLKGEDKIVGLSIIRIINYIKAQTLIDQLDKKNFPEDLMEKCEEIGLRLQGNKNKKSKGGIKDLSEIKATFTKGVITITLQKNVFNHVKKLLEDGHYFNAVEESYKIVREKLREKTGQEKATDAFSENNIELIFGHKAKNLIEKDFFDGVKFLHFAIQFLRNEKSHTPSYEMDKNLALHYISLASLAYDLINRD